MDTKTRQKNGKIAVYTAIFGPEDFLQIPLCRPEGVDFICFTDQPFVSKVWDVRKVAPSFPNDLTRSNREYKFFPNRFLPEYETSIYIDGNMIIRGDITELVARHLRDANIAFFDHAANKDFPRDCIYDEAEALFELDRKGKRKDDPAIIRAQADHYRNEGYPAHHGLITGMLIARRHHAPDVVRAMEGWWNELSTWSKRDQMSFNYVAWKQGRHYAIIPGDSVDNAYVRRVSHRVPMHRRIIGRFQGAWKRILRVLRMGSGRVS